MTLCYSFLKFGKVSTTDLVVPVSFVILYSLHSTSQIQHKLKLPTTEAEKMAAVNDNAVCCETTGRLAVVFQCQILVKRRPTLLIFCLDIGRT